VLIPGETGTGKELAARCIHFMSANRKKAFVSVDCSTLVPSVIESEPFGYAQGSSTDACEDKPRLLAAASGGTLFLDEIAELRSDLQRKLLAVLPENQFRPPGAAAPKHLDARVISATDHNLLKGIAAGQFREDLYYRLNGMQIDLPPLRERKGDIPLLVDSFVAKFSGYDPRARFSHAAMTCLCDYDWPGNVRELKNTVERAVSLSNGQVIEMGDLHLGCRNELPPDAEGSP
jgi:DNA-binding NtrC family response regulator